MSIAMLLAAHAAFAVGGYSVAIFPAGIGVGIWLGGMWTALREPI
jgi:hypothetical protein